MSEHTKVSAQIDHCTTTAAGAAEDARSPGVALTCDAVHPVALAQEHCRDCGKLTPRRSDRTHRCRDCAQEHRQQLEQDEASTAAAASVPLPQSPPPRLFGRPEGCADQLSEVERSAIATLHQLGWTGRDIAELLHCSENTVSLWVCRWRAEHSVADAERSGRPRSTADEIDEDISLYSDAHVTATPRDIVHALELDVDRRTVRRRLNEVGLRSCVQRAEHENVLARLAFAEGYSRWDEDDWAKVLFSDETHFYLGHHGREYVNRPIGAALDPKYTRKDNEQLRGKVTLWGCICSDGLGHAELYDESLTAQRYQSILHLNLVRSAHQFWPRGQWWFQQDGATPHTAGTSRAWFHNHGIDLIDWPAWSPDLNPIEELWHDLKVRVYARHPHSMEELERYVTEEWAATDLEFICHICRNMPRRLQLVVANHGHKIPY